MNIGRGALLSKLTEVAIGLSSKEELEQSNCLVFKGDNLVTFNGEIMAMTDNPLGFDVVVNAADFTGILEKIPDDEIIIKLREGELVVKGARRSAGLACVVEVTLPIDAVPDPGKFTRLGEGVLSALQQAARVCGDDDSEYLTTVVHVGPDRIEGCDNFRLFRVDGATGFSADVLIPSTTIQILERAELTKVAIGEGWVHFKTAGGARVSCRCSHEPYHDSLDVLLKMDEAENITLPATLKEGIERAEVFNSGDYNSKMGIRIAEDELVITSRKEGGWYKERKRVEYSGRPLNFEINPKFLVEILGRTRDVSIDDRRMKILSDRIQFVVCLTAKDADTSGGKDVE